MTKEMMFYMKGILYFILLYPIVAIPQINLYNTDWINEHVMQQTCLHMMASTEPSNIDRRIVSFCMSELSLEFDIKATTLFPSFTFAELSKQNITSQQLYLWSAPIDLVEQYQFYLLSNDQSMSREVFYNCTMPRFGLLCQYEFEHYDPNYSSFSDVVDGFYRTYEYSPTTFTCYMHLQCNRGPSPACLDWTEICDGHADCFNSTIDEEHCWQLEINECKDNEYRCANGQCIPQEFYKDNMITPDCFDGSDEYDIFSIEYRYCETKDLSFKCEDVACTAKPWTSSCIQRREDLLAQAIFSVKDNSTSDECWSAFKCIVPLPVHPDFICNDYCRYEACIEIIERTCPEMLYIPVVPMLQNDIYFAYQKNDSKIFNKGASCHPYVCFNNSRYDTYFVTASKILFNDTMCYRNLSQSVLCSGNFWRNSEYLIKLYRLFWSYSQIYNYTPAICQRSSMYQCNHSRKCISIHRLNNGINDCPDGDDENRISIDNTVLPEEIIQIEPWWDNEYVHKLITAKKKISFQTICDGFIELLPIMINGYNETDETECEQWQCNNLYTRCDGIWNCLNGADELSCNLSSQSHCSKDHHLCVSPDTNKLICLPIEKANDGNIDCLGAADEPTLCRKQYTTMHQVNFYCRNQKTSSSCISAYSLCNGHNNCNYGDDEQFCEKNRSSNSHYGICWSYNVLSNSIVEKSLCESMVMKEKDFIVYFRLDGMSKSGEDLLEHVDDILKPSSSIIRMDSEYKPRCHRGLDLRVWLNDNKNSIRRTCLCPPTFYGDICQYQNQRIDLTIKFRALSDSWQTPFVIVISLIDDSDERIIHSSEQITFLLLRNCNVKYNMYLLYSTRPKDSTKNYAIHIDIYEKISLTYQKSLLFPITFPFLPVHRLAFIVDISRRNYIVQTCRRDSCVHGQCIRYSNNPDETSFCQCYPGWSGKYCTMPFNCMCSSDSLCIGKMANNRSICVCPINKFGSRCFIDVIYQNSICQNGGQSIPSDEYTVSKQTFTCICLKGFSGVSCEIEDNKLILSFEEKIVLSQSIFIHFIEIIKKNSPIRATTFRTIPIKQNSIVIPWLRPFHLVFIELEGKNYYLAVVQKTCQRSTTINKMISSPDRCPHISEILNKNLLNLHLIRRIKYYHLPCQEVSMNLSCFHDEVHICLCYNHGEKRLANCFDFQHNMTFDCLGQSECENEGQCFQDAPDCPQRSICVCPSCYYGTRCQFSTSGFGLSLDGILGYHILPHFSITKQPCIVQISAVLTMLFVVIGGIDGLFAMITFKNKIIREVGCGLYLLSSSITALFTIFMFGLKFWILVLTQMAVITNRSFLSFQCYSFDFLLRICLSMDQWLSACVALERVITSKKGTAFSKQKSKRAAKIVISILLIVMVVTSIHDPLYRRLIVEENDNDEKRIWCIVTHSSRLQIYNSAVYIVHFFGPFMINLISAILLITKQTRRQSHLQTQRTYKQLLREQVRQHQHLFTAPILLVILALPRLIIFFVSKCMKSTNDAWLFLIGYFISFIPPIFTFVIFILPSQFYKKHFHNSVAPYRSGLHRRFNLS